MFITYCNKYVYTLLLSLSDDKYSTSNPDDKFGSKFV